MKGFRLLAIAPVAAALIAAGCGSGANNGQAGHGGAPADGNRTTATTRTAPAAGATVAVTKLNVGNALVDGQGRTLYLFEADKSSTSTCSGACASLWPPATTSSQPMAGAGVDAAKLGTTKRTDGRLEVTYNGHPLYRYAPDTKPGQATGQGLNQFGAKWYVLAASGSKIDDD